MKTKFRVLYRAEEIVAGALLGLIAILVFASAVARTIGNPINWAQDIALLAFAWLTFIGADLVARSGKLIRIDMLVNKFPLAMRKPLAILFDVGMLLFLLILVVYGFILVSQSWNRMFNTLKLSYAWCTLSVSVGAILLMTTIAEVLVNDIRKTGTEWGDK